MIYGPRDVEVLVFFRSVRYGVLPYMGSKARGVSAIFAADCAAACIAALDAAVPSGRTYTVDDGRTETFGDLVQHIESALGKRTWLRLPVPRQLLEVAAFGSEAMGRLSNKAVMLTRDKCNELYAPHWVCDSVDAQRELGWTPKVPFDRGARITAEWYRKQGLL
jgi:nucleoside-diphosphate-sugar epimerase